MSLTVGEIHGKLVNVMDEHDPVLDQFLHSNNQLLPSIQLTRESAPLPPTETATPPGQEYAQQGFHTFLTNPLNQCAQDVVKGFESITTNTPFYDLPRVLSELAQTYFRPNRQLENEPPTMQKDVIRSMAWHPHRNMIAFADEHDAIYVYEREGQQQGWKREVLRHTFMRDITCIEWKKRARGTLAVGCRKGVCVWNLGSESEQDSASMNYLCHPEHEQISSVAWDPTPGSHLLATTSGTVGTIVVYDTMSLSTMPLKRKGKGNLLLRWSPNGRWIYVATKSGTSRMWDTLDWTYKELNNPPGLWVQSACWAPDSRSLLLSMHGKSDVHLIYWTGSSNASEISHEKVYSALPAVDSVAGDDKCFTVGDSIKELVLCPDTGRRLAVIFDNSSTVALYAVDIESPLTLKNKSALTKIGNVNGPFVNLSSDQAPQNDINNNNNNNSSLSIEPITNRKPVHISLSSRFSTTNTLAILYDNETVSFMSIEP